MEFKKGSTYTRDEIHTLYFQQPVPPIGTGNWTTGYVRVEDELIVFMNINVPGTTGHDFPNRYGPSNKSIVWYGKPDSHSQQNTFQKLLNKELTPHYFARWNTGDPFTYLGVGNILSYKDGYPTERRDGTPTTTIEVTLTCEDTQQILPVTIADDVPQTTFALEKYLEAFIVDNWDSLDLGKKYDLNEEEIDGKRKKFRTDTGEIDIFALSKDKKEFLVIELKKGRASYAVVGQIQTYMGYVKDEVAKNNESVKGLIIALEDDLKIKRALSINPDIGFYRYKVNFELIRES